MGVERNIGGEDVYSPAVYRLMALEEAACELERMARGHDGYGCKVLNDAAARIRALAKQHPPI